MVLVHLVAMIGIIGAMPEEIDSLLAAMDTQLAQQRGPFTLHIGRLEQQGVLIAQCGVGKVNAAALTQTLIHQGVTKIIFTGVAGGLAPGLQVGDIVVSTDCVQHDLDVSALGYQRGEIPGEAFNWHADEHLHAAALTAAQTIAGINVIAGRIVSGDQFVSSAAHSKQLRDTFTAACAEMEGASVAQICSKWDIPFVIIRSISDVADEAAKMDFREFTPLAAARAEQVVRGMLRTM